MARIFADVNEKNLTVGSGGVGALDHQLRRHVYVGQSTSVGRSNGISTITFNNGTLTTKSLFAATNQLFGTGTVNTNGLIADGDLVIDASHPIQQQFVFNVALDQNVVVNLTGDGGTLGAGYIGQGTLTIADGKTVTSLVGYLGYQSGSNGVGTITGVSSLETATRASTSAAAAPARSRFRMVLSLTPSMPASPKEPCTSPQQLEMDGHQ